MEERGCNSEDLEALLEFLSIGRSEEDALFAPQKEVLGSFVVLDLILPAFSRIDCLHLIIIVENHT